MKYIKKFESKEFKEGDYVFVINYNHSYDDDDKINYAIKHNITQIDSIEERISSELIEATSNENLNKVKELIH